MYGEIPFEPDAVSTDEGKSYKITTALVIILLFWQFLCRLEFMEIK